jgi:flagellar basal-body rod modification protein FlgD
MTPIAQSHSASTSSSTQSADSLTNTTVFMQLLVAQLENQDPLNPADGTTFVTQLAQFASLEQLNTISSDVGTIQGAVAPAQISSSDSGGKSTPTT